MLFGGILLILLLTFLAVRLLSGRKEKAPEAAVSASVSEISAAADHMDAVEEPAPTVTPEAENTEAGETDRSEMVSEDETGLVTALVTKYFNGLASRDPEAVRACVDTLSEEDAVQVEENTQITSYKDVQVYTFEGTDEQSRAAFVSYTYTVEGSEAEIPALTQFYVYDIGNGDWRLASDPSDEAVQQRLQELTQSEAVQTLISTVQAQYDQVVAEHPELQ